MKNILTIFATLVLFSASVIAQTLTVHEWGTFTTLHGSSGGTLSGLYFEEEQLPPFVYHFPGFAPDSTIAVTGYRPCNNVTVKMETPVLYFYSGIERKVQIHVDFPTGTISQWYPNRSDGEETPVGIMDFGMKRTGSIDWNATVLSPSTTEKFTQLNVSAYHKWTDPRNTNSNLVKNDAGEVEKYLFYRGLANFSLPVEVKFIDSVHLSVSNTSTIDLPFIYIYDHTTTSYAGIWGIGPLKAGETKIFKPRNSYYEDAHILENDTFRLALQNAGLTKLEAQAMLNTWQDGYFQTLGFKIFWIVPRELTDQILPIRITPTPDTLQRVLVEKTEVLTPKFERQLFADYKAGRMANYSADRYLLAYLQRAQELQHEYDASPKPLTVHEWGTFTTLRGSSGGTLSGLYFEEEPLPPFVYHFPGFSPDLSISPCKNVTVKMETPVLYFYSEVEKQIQVHVDFPMGSISQWYPNRSSGEVIPIGDTIDFSQPRKGSIQWNAKVLPRNTEEQLTETTNTTPKWEAPRQTDANLVKSENGEVEKYLFYRGLANFSLPLNMLFHDSTSLSVTNTSQLDIPFVYIYDNSDPSNPKVWGTGPLSQGKTRYFYQSEAISQFGLSDFLMALHSAGLTEMEAQALLNTWSDGYFQTKGFKVFWILPRPLTDQILPLWINPWPDTLQRVLVGKTEILTPTFEKQLLDRYTVTGNLDPWNADRYHLAYLQRVKELYKPVITEAVEDSKTSNEYTIAPNPASSSFYVRGALAISSVTIRNMLGETMLHSQSNITDLSEFDIHSLPSGIYFVTIAAGDNWQTLKLIKR